MRRLTALDPDEAPGKSRELLTDLVERHGSVGEMVATMAHSPALLEGYLGLTRAMKRSKIPRPLSEKISLAAQEWIGCEMCRQAHAQAARKAGLSEQDIALARQGTATDAREAALIGAALRVLTEPASFSDEDVAELRAHGWSDRVLAEIVGLVALNLMTGAFNLLAGIEPAPDPPAGIEAAPDPPAGIEAAPDAS
ncbi:alkylhydroperoxidase AhpD family core domain-containing protein [Nonomuraea solani]|uniref:Alkylhydroperoxidase AhpD family core domain-containing protein n=1 Tax=Nonomuraea solani TaxID=1144553 RepID=A0A1H5ZTC9_9ACTN|nr:carboxymuconolactone decarboxylase family protein [Nonomuraea solani]SEG39748.1 alkylhydroperoxidase AhpD family core domain-containing protein [Nonomuraea solani]